MYINIVFRRGLFRIIEYTDISNKNFLQGITSQQSKNTTGILRYCLK